MTAAADDSFADVTAPAVVQVQVSADRKTLWVNVDGLCRFRACRIGSLEFEEFAAATPPVAASGPAGGGV